VPENEQQKHGAKKKRETPPLHTICTMGRINMYAMTVGGEKLIPNALKTSRRAPSK
jgi:hypothetical protein